jgi:hypothetical protein
MFELSSKIGVGTATPDRTFHVELDDANNNTVSYTNRNTHTTSGTPGVGIGVGIEFEIETGTGNNEIGATIEAVTTDVTSTSEDVDLLFKVMQGGSSKSAVRVRADTSADNVSLVIGEGFSSINTRTIIAGGTTADHSIGLLGKGAGGVALSGGNGNHSLSVVSSISMATTASVSIASTGSATSISISASSTNTVLNSLTVTRLSSGSPAAGIGTSLSFLTQTDVSNSEFGCTIESVTTDVTSASEDFDMVLKTMAAGATAAERLRLNDSGAIIPATAAFYIGPVATNGSWRIIQSGDDLLIQQREAGSYVTKSTISGA